VQDTARSELCTFRPAVVVVKAQLSKLNHKELTRERMVPTISAEVSWLMLGMMVSGARLVFRAGRHT
jgi:hypothetical protein